MPKKLDPGKLTPETLALLLSNAGKRLITEQQVRIVAEAGGLLALDGSVNLIQYTAYLAKESDKRND